MTSFSLLCYNAGKSHLEKRDFSAEIVEMIAEYCAEGCQTEAAVFMR